MTLLALLNTYFLLLTSTANVSRPFPVYSLNMAVGKNKGLSKGGKKGGKKKVVDPFSRKDWYDVKAPNMFQTRQIGKTLVNRTQGQRIASDYLKGRVFEVSLADLQKDIDPERSFRKFRLIAEDVQDRNVLCNFHGMDLTTDKYRLVNVINAQVCPLCMYFCIMYCICLLKYCFFCSGQWLKSGKHLLKPLLKPRLSMVTFCECFALDSLPRISSLSAKHAMPNSRRSARFALA